MTLNKQYLDASMGGNAPKFIDSTNGVLTGQVYNFLYVLSDATFTTLTDSADADLRASSLITTKTIPAGAIIAPATGRTIKAVTVASGMVQAITLPATSV